MMASDLHEVYIDKEWMAKEYLQRCSKRAWKKEKAQKEALKCWKLERIIGAALIGESMDECVGDCAGNTISTTKEI